MTPDNILITGLPGCGKSFLIETVVRNLQRPATGFFTREIREQGGRTGFEVVTLTGERGLLAHVSLESSMRVGKYGVTLEALEQIAVPSMHPSILDEVVVVDEIGKMECLSRLFCETLIRALDAPNLVLGTVAAKGDAFIENIKVRRDVLVIGVTREDVDVVARDVTRMLLNS